MKKIFFIFLFGIMLVSLSACSTSGRSELIGEAVSKTPTKGITEIEVKLSRRKLKEYLSRGDAMNQARFVPVYRRGGTSGEFRLFDIKDGSVYQMLGLKSLDIIVSAHGYLINGGNVFWYYLQMMPEMEDGSIEVRRNGLPLLFKYKFI